MPREDRPPFQPLSDRLAGKPLDTALSKGVPVYLEYALREWLETAFRRASSSAYSSDELATEVALRLRLDDSFGSRDRVYRNALRGASRERLLDVVDAMLYCFPEHEVSPTKELQSILEHSGSAYRVDDSDRQLVLRVDETVENAAAGSASAATDQTADYLRRAWRHAYGLDPDPTAAYKEAVRAVEEAFVPVVSPKNTRASLGTVCRDLSGQEEEWEFILVDDRDEPSTVAHLVGLLRQLWQGQRSRHGGGANSRDQTQAEAEAAVHLAALAVQLVSTGALRRKS